MMEENEVKIVYSHKFSTKEASNRQLDNRFEEMMEKLGYNFYLTDYDYIEQARILTFRK